MNQLCDTAAALAQSLCQRITAARYEFWFLGKTKFTLEDDRLVVGVKNLHYQDWLSKKFGDDVRAAVLEVVGEPRMVTFVIDPELFQAGRAEQRAEPRDGTAPQAKTAAIPAAAAVTAPEGFRRGLRKFKRLEDFVVGSCNRVAHAAAVGVVEEPGMTPIPMVLHGPVGSGKSHLLDGIHAAIKERYPDARIMHLTAEDFTNRFLASMQHNKQPTFRRQFRDCDVLLVDDLQFLARKTATQVEFMHTLETLQREGRTVIVSCDCHPRLADIFQPELTDRLVGGAVHGLAWPDGSTRRAMLAAKANLPADVIDLMAEKLRGNVRELEGAVHSVVHLARVTGRPLSTEVAREALSEVLRASVRTITLADIERAVNAALGLPTGSLQSRQRQGQIAGPRMLAMYLARKHTAATYSEIGQHFGRRNHSTAVAAEKRVRLWLADRGQILLAAQKAPVKDVLDRIEEELAR